MPRLASEVAEERHQVVNAVFFDCDGVINANLERNGKPVAPTNLSDFRILPGVAEATRLLKEAGFLLVIVTNQPDVANGLTPKATVEAMHAEIMRQCRSDIIVCFHADADNCSCRKPKPGMILEAAAGTGSTSPRAISSATVGATCTPAAAPAAARSLSTTAIRRTSPINRTSWSIRCARRLISSYMPLF